MKHTEGPWELSGDIIIGPPVQPPNPKAQPTSHVICKMGWDFDGDRGRTGDLPWAVAEANARLIASTPDLLGIAENIHLNINGLHATMRATNNAYRGTELCRQMDALIRDNAAAITKARG